ncbi:MFS general substrate transporter [Backusella circina FSU 941]|nr:MFS general substrate transporter [Backusella circina FSU 941]
MDKDNYGSIVQFGNSQTINENGKGKCIITLYHPPPIQKSKTSTAILLTGLACCICSCSFSDAGLAPCIGRISYEFHDSKNLSWYATSFLLTTAVFQLLAVRISDCLGRRRVLLFAIALMFLSSLIGGFAGDRALFLTCRVLQGCASGLCQSLVVAALVDLFPLEKRVKYQPVINASYGVTSIVAPVLAGIYVDHLSWRFTFWTEAILTIPTFIIIYLLLNIPLRPDQRISRKNLKLLLFRRIDPIGCLTASAGVILFLTSLNLASASPSLWSSPLVLGLLAGSIVMCLCFIIFEKVVTPWPLFPSEMLIESRDLVLSYLLVFICGWNYILFDLLIFIEYQTVYNATPTEAGLMLIPPTIVFIISSLVASKMLQWLRDIKPVNIIGNGINCIGILMMIFFQQLNSHIAIRITCMMVYAIGTGFSGQVVGLATQMILEDRKHPELAASSMALVRCLIGFSGAVSTAVSLAFLQTELTKHINNTSPDIYAILRDSGVIENYTRIRYISSEMVLRVIRSIYLESFKSVYWIFFAWSVVGTIAAVVINVPKIKK